MQAPPETLKEMEKCARALAKSVQYIGAATVEFLYDLESCMYFFLELNPRLQVSPAYCDEPAGDPSLMYLFPSLAAQSLAASTMNCKAVC